MRKLQYCNMTTLLQIFVKGAYVIIVFETHLGILKNTNVSCIINEKLCERLPTCIQSMTMKISKNINFSKTSFFKKSINTKNIRHNITSNESGIGMYYHFSQVQIIFDWREVRTNKSIAKYNNIWKLQYIIC